MKPLLLPALLLLLTPWAVAQEPGTPPPMGGKSQNGIQEKTEKWLLSNESFVKKAAAAGQTEIDLSKLALEKSQDQNVKAFAERMVKDHSAAAEKLQTIARSKGLPLPEGEPRAEKSESQKLEKLSGADFDREYGKVMRKDHDKAVKLFTAAAGSQKLDPELRQFAEQTLPTLREHQQQAKGLPGHDHASAAGS